MTLEEMFVDIKYRHDGRGARDAKRGVLDIKDAVEGLKSSLDKVNRALNVLSGVAVVTATAGTVAYSNWTRTVSELAGKAGLATKEFRKLYTAESGAITRMVGGDRRLALESMQRAHSLGANERQAHYLARLGSILQSGRQAHSATAVEAAMSLQAGGFGEAGDNLQRVYASAQLGAGNVGDYFSAARRAGGIASAAGVGLEDLLSMLTIGSQGGSMSEATTRTMAVIRAMARNAPKQAQDYFRERTGRDWSYLSEMQRNEGTLAAVDFISKNFKDSELFKLFTEVEAVNLIKPLMQQLDTARSNRATIAGAPEARYIEAFGEDIGKEFFNSVERFRNTIGDFLKAFGKPFATLLAPLLNVFTRLVDAMLRLNEFTGGLLAWIPALLSTLLVLRKVILGRLLIGLMQALWERLGALAVAIRTMARDSKVGQAAAKGAQESREFARGAGAAAAGVALGASLTSMGGFFKGIFAAIKNLFVNVLNKPGGVGAVYGIISKSTTISVKLVAVLTLLAVGIKILVGWLGKLAVVLGFFALWSKFRSPDSFDPTRHGYQGSQMRYFDEGKPLGDHPAPNWRDIVRHDRVVAEEEFDSLWNEIKAGVSGFFTDVSVYIRANAPNFIVAAWDSLTGALMYVINGIDEMFIWIGERIREFMDSPVDAIGSIYDRLSTFRTKLLSKGLEAALSLFSDGPTDESTAVGTQPHRRVLGGAGVPDTLIGSDGRSMDLRLPVPAIPESEKNPISVNLSTGDINVDLSGGQPGDFDSLTNRFKEAIDDVLKDNADRIIQEMDWASSGA